MLTRRACLTSGLRVAACFRRGLATARQIEPSAVQTIAKSLPQADTAALDRTKPPMFPAKTLVLDTFSLPGRPINAASDLPLAKAIVAAMRRDGIFQIAMDAAQQRAADDMYAAMRRFFALPMDVKERCVDPRSFAGYTASGEEVTNGIRDYSEIFTVVKDLPLDDWRVKADWPCHGPCPWPDDGGDLARAANAYFKAYGVAGEKVLALLELGLGVPKGSFTSLTRDGWHHSRLLRFPPANNTNGKGKEGRGIGAHTDYGLLIFAGQETIGGLYIRPPLDPASVATQRGGPVDPEYPSTDGWVYIPPVPGTVAIFGGDILQYMTNSYLQSTPHRVILNTTERFAVAYFHEPSFQATALPLPGYDGGQAPRDGMHYGSHFTTNFVRSYPERVTTKRLLESDRLELLKTAPLRTMN